MTDLIRSHIPLPILEQLDALDAEPSYVRALALGITAGAWARSCQDPELVDTVHQYLSDQVGRALEGAQ